MRPHSKLVLSFVAAGAGLLTAAVAPAATDPVLWPEHQRAFFQDGPALLMSAAERARFAAADEAGRDRLLEEFFADPVPQSPENELLQAIEKRKKLVRLEAGSPLDDRAKLLFLHGKPSATEEVDCGTALVPLAIWSYGPSDPVLLLFRDMSRGPGYWLWMPNDGKRVLYSTLMKGWYRELSDYGREAARLDIERCAAVARVDEVTRTIGLIDETPSVALTREIEAFLKPPADLGRWVREALATQLPPAVPELPIAEVGVRFPYHSGQRIVTELWVKLDDVSLAAGDGDEPKYRLEVAGALEQDGRHFDDFKYRFDHDPPGEGEPIFVVFEHTLRPNRHFLARFTVRDAFGGAESEVVRAFSVPSLDEVTASYADALLAGDPDAPARDLEIVPPLADGLSKTWRVDVRVGNESVAKVAFLVDGELQLTRTRPPFTADVRLADVPREQVVSVEGFDRFGKLVAEDRVLLNQALGAFAVKLVSPTLEELGGRQPEPAVARAQVQVPPDRRLESVEFSLDDETIATLDAPPWEAEFEVPGGGEVSYLTVEAFLADGARAEDVLILNAPANLDNVDVELIELFATVSDGSGRLVSGLTAEDFVVREAGAERPVERFDLVHNLPLVLGFAIDTSGSMGDHLATARQAAVGFLESIMDQGDRAFAVSFSDRPRLAAPPTDDPSVVERALQEVHSEGWTTLYDGIVRSLFHFRGFGGRRALVVLSDGEDTSSRSTFEDTLRYARESGVVIYAVALGKGGLGLRTRLKRLAGETGGEYFHVDRADELAGVYDDIERELRSQYFLAFTPRTPGETKLADVEVALRSGRLKIRTTRGYAP